MTTTLPKGVKLLITHNGVATEVLAFEDMPVDFADLTTTMKTRDEFVAADMKGFIVEDVSDSEAIVLFLNLADLPMLKLGLGEGYEVEFDGHVYEVKLLATRTSESEPGEWNGL